AVVSTTFNLDWRNRGVDEFGNETSSGGERGQWEGSNTTNNSSVDPDPITITQPPHPDLQVESVTPAAARFQAGGTLGLSFKVINQGTVSTSTPHWTDRVYLSLDDKFSTDDLPLTSAGNQSALDPTQDYETTISGVPIPKDKAGTYYLIVVADADNNVDEYPNDNNNVRASDPFTIDPLPPSDLVASNVVAPDQVVEG